jgi:hypothetical protein
VDLPRSLVPESRDKTPLGRRKAPLDVENLLEFSALRIIWPSRPAAEFLPGFEAGRELAAEFDSRTLARISIMKSHLIIDIIALTRYIGTGPAGARGREHRSAG